MQQTLMQLQLCRRQQQGRYWVLPVCAQTWRLPWRTGALPPPPLLLLPPPLLLLLPLLLPLLPATHASLCTHTRWP